MSKSTCNRVARLFVAALAVFAAAVTSSADGRAAMNYATKWRKWDGSARDCIENSERVLKAAQFRNFNFTNDSEDDRFISGDRGQYIGGVQCVEEMKIAFFIVIGPDDKKCDEYIEELVGRF